MGKSPNSLLTDDDDGNCMLHLGSNFQVTNGFHGISFDPQNNPVICTGPVYRRGNSSGMISNLPKTHAQEWWRLTLDHQLPFLRLLTCTYYKPCNANLKTIFPSTCTCKLYISVKIFYNLN